MYCIECGSENPELGRFCYKCGHPLFHSEGSRRVQTEISSPSAGLDSTLSESESHSNKLVSNGKEQVGAQRVEDLVHSLPPPTANGQTRPGSKSCPICHLINPGTAKVCDCGYDFEISTRGNPICPDTTAQTSGAKALPQYFSVSIPKLIVMSVCTLGIYEFYWLYKNWQLVQGRATNQWDAQISPFWRAFFGILYLYPLLKLVRQSMRDHSISGSLSPGWLTFGFIVILVFSRLPDPLWIISLLSFIPLICVQNKVNAINAKTAPDAMMNSRFSGLNIAGIVLGGLVIALAVLNIFVKS